MKRFYLWTLVLIFLSGCASSRKTTAIYNTAGKEIKSTIILKGNVPAKSINTRNVAASKVVEFAQTLIGTPYKYGSSEPKKGLDCSGFIYYVFQKFKISVPRTSKDFTNAGEEISTLNSRKGDIILFTGSDVNSGMVGHMGIITENNNGILKFLHSASGNNAGVMVSGMNSYFMPRFVKVIRVFRVF